MKLLHTSDWHLGQNFMGKSRQEEHKAFLTWLLNVLEEEKVELLLVSGDVFDTGTPPNYALELYYNFLKELSNISTLKSTIITAGNHDSIATIKAPQQLLKILNVHVIASGDVDEDVIVPVKDNESIKAIVCAVPYLRDSVIRESLCGETLSEKEKQANQGIKNYYESVYKQALELQTDENIPIIAMGHLTTVGSRTSESEREIYIGGTLDIGGDYLASMFDYVALGHLHINQKVGNEHVRYSGSPIPLSFSESKNTQKINIVTFKNNDATIKELEVPRQRELFVLKGKLEVIKKDLKNIEDTSAWIEIHLQDDNPMQANIEIRELANKLHLTLLAVKIDKTQKQLQAKELKAISLDELSVNEVFEKRLELEEITEKELSNELKNSFAQIVSMVQKV
ncbi:MAG: exonuclease SbcCD subunit D C-terminal domain-containing protein [Campylobacterales bacterium]|nr:exonuclease SbcCD subunit D C-terminal domain-containing protein [Campylobacterales bacterium]